VSSPAETTGSGTRYSFKKRLASGGMADLFVAEALAAGGVRKQVAIKRVQPRHASDDDFVTMFLNEARLASTLQHPHIVQTYDVLQVRGEYFIIMELLEGIDLQQFLKIQPRSGVPLRTGHVLYLVERALAALHYAHERKGPDGELLGIAHRDVSPHNLFLTYEGGVKLLDFGIAKMQTMDAPSEGNVLKGKVLYMAPEQCQAGEIDRRTDLYSVGVMLYRLLSGSFPHRGSNAFDTMRAILHDEPRPLREITPGLPEEFDRLVMKALAKDPDQRFQTARDMQLEIMGIIRTFGLFLSDLDFANLVQEVAPRDRKRKPLPDDVPLPDDLIVGLGEAPPSDDTGSHGSLADQELVSTDVAVVRRVSGMLVLQLRGSIDERLDVAQLVPHVGGDLIVDTEHVMRVSSYGIRQLMTLFDQRSPGMLYHIRVSPDYMEQVSMIRGLLGGGQVLSFHLPFVDPQTGNTFSELVTGEAAQRIVTSREPPPTPCPGFPDRMAEFDDDPDSFLAFGSDFLATPPEPVAQAIRAMDAGGSSKAVEKEIDATSTTLRVLRPLTSAMRWNRLVRGVEGRLVLDLENVPYWDDTGLHQLGEALEYVADQLSAVEFRGVPVEVYSFLKGQDALAGARQVATLRLSTECTDCNSPRQVVVAAAQLDELRTLGAVRTDACHRCGGALAVRSELPQLTAVPAQPRSTAPSPSASASASAPASPRAGSSAAASSRRGAPPPSMPSHVLAPPPPATGGGPLGVPWMVWLIVGLTVVALLASLVLLIVAVAVFV